MQLKKLKQELFKDPAFRREYYNNKDLAFEISEMLKELRLKNGLTQKELAEKVGTKQPSIARLESVENGLPSLSFLQRIAKALDTYLIPPKFASLEGTKTVGGKIDFLRKDSKFEKGSFVFSPNESVSFKINSTK